MDDLINPDYQSDASNAVVWLHRKTFHHIFSLYSAWLMPLKPRSYKITCPRHIITTMQTIIKEDFRYEQSDAFDPQPSLKTH